MADQNDVESQSSGSSGSGGGPPVEWVGTTMAPEKVAMWLAKIGTRPTGPVGHYNPHGMLAAQRFVAEKFACEELLRNQFSVVVDVGGAPHRTYAHLGARGRYLMPQVHLGDRTRRGRCPTDAAEHVCAHRFEECMCYEGESRVYLFTHSAYYLDPAVLWRVLRDYLVEDALVVEHVFDDMFGGFYDEAHWAIAEDMVVMSVAGNGNPYTHTLPPWQCGWVGAGGEVIEAEVLFEIDKCTRVVRLHPALSDRRPNQPLVWGEVETDVSRSGPVQFSSAAANAVADNARFTEITFDVMKIRKFGPVLYTDYMFKGETLRITVPVTGVALVADHVGLRPRTPELFAEVTHVMKNRWKKARIPPSLRAATLAAVVALGFVTNLRFETNVVHTMRERFSWMMDVHSILLQFGRVTVRWWLWVYVGLLFAMVGFIVAETFDHDTDQRLIIAVAFGVLVPLCWFCFRTVLIVHQRWTRYLEAGWVSTYGDDESPRAPLLGQGFTLQNNLALPGSRCVKPPPGQVQGFLNLEASREKVVEPRRMLVSGIITDGAVPNALAQTQQAELSAVTNRILAPRKNAEEWAVEEFGAAFTLPEFTEVKKGIDTSFGYFMRWVEKLKKTYPLVYIQNMMEVWKTNQGVECPPVATKGFLKIEKAAATVNVDNNKPTKARLVQPPEDVDKAMTGSIIWQLWKKVREHWNGRNSPVMYCSGYSCSEIGLVVDDFINANDAVVAWSLDMASYDATLSLPLQKAAFGYYQYLGMPRWVQSWLMRVRSRGLTPNGVRYMPTRDYWFDNEEDARAFAKVYQKDKLIVISCSLEVHEVDGEFVQEWRVTVEDFQMTSGRMDTNLTDTVILVGSIVGRIPKGIPYLLLVCGDDAFLLLRKEHAFVVDRIKELMVGLGLKPEGLLTEDRSKWEFCSKLFWFGIDETTNKVQTVLGSKPFRGVARMGVNTTLPGAANAAASALSVRIDSGHVPFLGAFADRTYELCRKKKIRPTGKVEWTAIKGDRRFKPCSLNYAMTQARYGLGEENEHEFIARLASLDSVPIVLQYAPLWNAVLVDEA